MIRKCVIGVDLGGTNVRAGAFYQDGSRAGESYSNPSRAQEGIAATLESVGKTILQAAESAESAPNAVGLAIPGHVDDEGGIVAWAPNFGEFRQGVFHYWSGVKVKAPLESVVGLPISMGNDANLAALAEYRFGSGKNDAKCLVLLTLGTGVGGGVIMAPKAVQGDARGPLMLIGGNKGGAELGHVVVNYQGTECSSGEYGSLEAYCPRDAIVHRAQHALRRGRQSMLTQLSAGDIGAVTPKMLAEAADQGDEVAIEVWDAVGELLGVGIGNFINIFAPDIVAIGGQIAKAGEWIMKPAKRFARNVAIPTLFQDAQIRVAERIDDAGMLGAAALAMEARKWDPTT